MKIHHTGFGGVQPPVHSGVNGPHGAVGGRPAGTTSEAGFTPSSEFVKLIDLVKGQPEIRPDVVARAAQRLESGFYDTPASAEATADKILNPD